MKPQGLLAGREPGRQSRFEERDSCKCMKELLQVASLLQAFQKDLPLQQASVPVYDWGRRGYPLIQVPGQASLAVSLLAAMTGAASAVLRGLSVSLQVQRGESVSLPDEVDRRTTDEPSNAQRSSLD